ncbi:MAG TPA: hypothetical protein VK463_02055 [Desulfomonilaceae bacterium]|nr:hypothetical protein [Desulfomonilaceae bacterium]
MDVNELMKTIDWILDRPLSHQKDLFEASDRWVTPVQVRNKSRAHEDKFEYARPFSQSLEDHIHRRLGHIIVSLKDIHNSRMLMSAYMYNSQDSKRSDFFANENPVSAKALVEKLTAMSKESLNATDDGFQVDSAGKRAAAAGLNVIILHGRKGLGKTFFQNHLLSKYSTWLDRKHVIWVRLNLVRDFGDNSNLLHRIFAQLTKIVFRYYDPNSKLAADRKRPKEFIPLDISTELFRHFYDVSPNEESRRYYEGKILNLQSTFRDRVLDEPITPELIPEEIGREVFRIVRDRGYSFIIILDGLDRLEAIPHHKKKFDLLMDAVNRLAGGRNRMRGTALLIVTRTITFKNMVQMRPPVVPFVPDELKQRQMHAIDLAHIVDRRLKCIRKEIDVLISSGKCPHWDLSNWPNVIDNFRACLHEPEQDGKTPLDRLEEFHIKNNRAKMQSLQILFYDYLRGKFGKHYVLIEGLMKAGNRFPPVPYNYEFSEKTGILRRYNGSNRLDVHLLPSIFRFPVAMHNGGVKFPGKHCTLAGLRMLQICWSYGNGDEERPPLLVSQLGRICQILFDYDPDVVSNLAEEFNEFELFELAGLGFPTPLSVERASIACMPRSKLILDKLIKDLTYLNLGCMRIYFGEKCLGLDPIPFLKAANLDLDGLAEWTTWKILNSISMYRIMNHVNSLEVSRYAQRRSKLESELQRISDLAKTNGLFTFIHGIKKELMDQFPQILGSLEQGQRKQFAEQLKQYAKQWC